jgi:hypothetical protein
MLHKGNGGGGSYTALIKTSGMLAPNAIRTADLHSVATLCMAAMVRQWTSDIAIGSLCIVEFHKHECKMIKPLLKTPRCKTSSSPTRDLVQPSSQLSVGRAALQTRSTPHRSRGGARWRLGWGVAFGIVYGQDFDAFSPFSGVWWQSSGSAVHCIWSRL